MSWRVRSMINGRASVEGLWVCGEASSTGLHGANRLASNGLLEALVFARICAEGIEADLAPTDSAPLIELEFGAGGNPPPADAVKELRETMTSCVGVVRNEAGLRDALIKITALEEANTNSPSFLNMTATATMIAVCAYMRKESRGAHERSDYPEPDGAIGERSEIYYSDAIALRKQICEGTL